MFRPHEKMAEPAFLPLFIVFLHQEVEQCYGADVQNMVAGGMFVRVMFVGV